MLTVDEVKALVPAGARQSVTPEFVDEVNGLLLDPDVAESIREGFITYNKILTEGQYTLESYLSALKYVTYKQMGYNNKDAYAKTFPQRWLNMQAAGKSDKDISAHVAMYHKGKLVNKIMQQSMIPVWLTHQDAVYEAIKTHVNVMRNGTSEIAKVQAANSILTHIKRPEAAKLEIDVTNKNTSLDDLKSVLVQMAELQQQAIQSGQKTSQQVAHAPLIIEHNANGN